MRMSIAPLSATRRQISVTAITLFVVLALSILFHDGIEEFFSLAGRGYETSAVMQRDGIAAVVDRIF